MIRSRAIEPALAMAGLLFGASCAAQGSMPYVGGLGTHALQCDSSGALYLIQEPGRYVFHLESKNMGDKSDASLCIEPTPQGWLPPDPCRTGVRLDEWRLDRGADWIVELRPGNALAVWLQEGGFTSRASTRCAPGVQTDRAVFSASGNFAVTLMVSRL
jgi:hypothetical protein